MTPDTPTYDLDREEYMRRFEQIGAELGQIRNEMRQRFADEATRRQSGHIEIIERIDAMDAAAAIARALSDQRRSFWRWAYRTAFSVLTVTGTTAAILYYIGATR